MTTKKYDPLLLQNQLCFPLYASARKIVAAYHPMLKKLGITYPQYITMMVLWEEKEISMHVAPASTPAISLAIASG